jgi:hypothetical protein
MTRNAKQRQPGLGEKGVSDSSQQQARREIQALLASRATICDPSLASIGRVQESRDEVKSAHNRLHRQKAGRSPNSPSISRPCS